MNKIRMIAVIAIALLASNSVFAMQGRGGRGQGGAPAGAGRPSSPGGGVRGNQPSSLPAESKRPAEADSRGKSADHKPESAGPKEAEGFKNYGQYMAAKQAADHLGIPLKDLRKSMIDGDLSLGESIHKLRPDLSKKEVEAETKKGEAAGKKAEEEAKKKGKPTD